MLAPFAGLVALGFSLMSEPEPIALPPLAPVVRLQLPPEPPPLPPRPPPPQLPPPLPTTVQVIDPAPPLPLPPPGPVKPSAERSAAGKRQPFISAVDPLVQQCFRDVGHHVRGPLQVTVDFSPTLDGGFAQVVIKQTSWQDPILSACIVDSFEDARFASSGVAIPRQSYTFSSVRPDGGGF